jgi:hypothetical protein
MNIKIFMATATTSEERDTLRYFGQGVEKWVNENISDADKENLPTVRIGRWTALNRPTHSVEYEYNEGYVPCDIAVMFGSWKPREKGHHVVRSSVAGSAKTFICIETPLLSRRTDTTNQYYRIGINGFLNQSAYWPEPESVHANSQLSRLGIKWTGWDSNPKGHVLLALQLPGDASLRGIDINEWALRSIRSIRVWTDRPITIRSHPLISDRGFEHHIPLLAQAMKENISNITWSDGAVVPWATDLKGAYCTVTYTSGLAIDSVLAGIPTVACDPGNFAWDISTQSLDEIESLKFANDHVINEWLAQLAMCQWNYKQMRSGQAWQHLMSTLETIA